MADSTQDNRKVVLIKSLRTKNRFYALVHPDRNIRNADTVPETPPDLILGIAYPCLEDGLNDFAVIRTTFETLDLFSEDDPLREEMMEIVNDARDNLVRRLTELRDLIHENRSFFLGTDYNEFKAYTMGMINRGHQRRTLDSMMKLDVFSSVAEAEGFSDSNDLPYRYEFNEGALVADTSALPPREFIVALFDDVLSSVLDDKNYGRKYLFDRNVFQKFIAVMFVNYATTDPIFYGINRHDYAVSGDKEMDDTPLYIAIRREILQIEQHLVVESGVDGEPRVGVPEFDGRKDHLDLIYNDVELPSQLVNEEILLGPITSLCLTAKQLRRSVDADTVRRAQVVLDDATKLVTALKRIGVLSELTVNPAED